MTIPVIFAVFILAIATIGMICIGQVLGELNDEQEQRKKGNAGASSMFVRD